jgi:predicted nucleic acid-binding protein
MKPVIADTGPLFAAVDPGDQYHQRAQRELLELARSEYSVVVAWPTVFEAYTLVVRHLGTDAARTWVSELLDGTGQITPTDRDYQTATQGVARYPDQTITLFDALVAALSTRLGCPVWTYDHHFDIMQVAVWQHS